MRARRILRALPLIYCKLDYLSFHRNRRTAETTTASIRDPKINERRKCRRIADKVHREAPRNGLDLAASEGRFSSSDLPLSLPFYALFKFHYVEKPEMP